ncbi:MAG: hypothetical protein OEX78_09160 [Betaproteobacteria bacterium]|nr:hypothetical protein [Betaproteobacteria bacterium]
MNETPFTPAALADYLRGLHGAEVREVRVTPLGGGRQGDKGYGYGVPLRIDYTLAGEPRRAVLETVRPGPSATSTWPTARSCCSGRTARSTACRATCRRWT